MGIVLSQPDKQKHEFLFNQLILLKNILHKALEEEWIWITDIREEEKLISKIYTEKKGISVLKKEDWPGLISFFKPRIIALDKFWSLVKYEFEGWQ